MCPTDMDQLLTKSQIAERLNITKRTVELAIKNKRLPFIKLTNKTIRFEWPKVEDALRRFEVKAVGTGAPRVNKLKAAPANDHPPAGQDK